MGCCLSNSCVLLYGTWAFAPGLSFPYPSRRLITPHTATPAPIAVTTVFNPVTADVKNAIFSYLVLSENLFFAKNKEHCFLSAKLLYLWTSCPNVPIQLYPGKSPRIQRLHLPLSFLWPSSGADVSHTVPYQRHFSCQSRKGTCTSGVW